MAETSLGPAVRRATPGQLDALSRVLARAFADDPMIRWPFPDLPDPEAALQICFRAWNAGNIELGLVFEVAGGAGFAVWVPPDRAGSWLETERLARPVIIGLTDDGGARYDRLWDWIEERMPAGPLWYLDQLGVDPSHQGEGLGRGLVRFGLDRAAAAGLPAFLETAREQPGLLRLAGVPGGRRGNRAGRRAANLVHALRPGPVRPAGCAG